MRLDLKAVQMGFCSNLKQGCVSDLERYLMIGGRVNKFKFLRTKVERAYLSSEYSGEKPFRRNGENGEKWGINFYKMVVTPFNLKEVSLALLFIWFF
jgi:hypothetical protein